MATGTNIGVLRVILGADTSSLETGLKGSQASLARFASGMKAIGITAAAGLTAAVAGVGVAVKNSLNDADKLGKLAQSVGLPVEELSKLQHAAKLSDVSLDELGKSLVKLSKNMADVAAEGTGPAAQAFRALGISVKEADGSTKSSSKILDEVADKFATYKDGVNKTAIAVALFGKSGAEMIPMLNGGSDAIRNAKEEAEKFGLVISADVARQAEQFNDNMTRLGAIMDGVSTQLAGGLVEELGNLSEEFVRLANDANLMKAGVEGAQFVLRSFGTVVVAVTAWYKEWIQTIAAGAKIMSQIGDFEFKAAFETLQGNLAESKRIFVEADKASERFWNPDTRPLIQGLDTFNAKMREAVTIGQQFVSAPWSAGLDEFNSKMREATVTAKTFFDNNKRDAPAMAAEASKALKNFLDNQEKAIQARNIEAATMGGQIGVAERLKLEQQAELIRMQQKIAMTPELSARIKQLGVDAEEASWKMRGAELAQEAMTPGEKQFERFEMLQELMARGKISTELYSKAMGQMWITAGTSIASSFTDITQSMAKMGKENAKMVKAAQIFAAAMALIDTLAAQAKALLLPFPMNLAAGAAIAAKGFALVAAIKATPVPSASMSTGGMFTVPGSGGPDSKSYLMNLTPGEEVRVNRPGDPGYGDGASAGPGGTFNIHLNGRRNFSSDEMRDLFDQMNEFMGNGYKLKVVS